MQLEGNSSVKQDLVHLKAYGTTILRAFSSVLELRLPPSGTLMSQPFMNFENE